MRKTLATLFLAAGLAGSSLADSLELHKELTDRNRGAVVEAFDYKSVAYSGERIIPARDYKAFVRASKHDFFEGKVQRNLIFGMYDDKTSVYIADTGADNFGKGDSLDLSHRFSNGDIITLSLQYRGEGIHYLFASLHDETSGERYMITGDTKELNALTRKMVHFKLRHITEWSGILYDELVNAAISKREADLPFRDLKEALKRIEPILPKIKNQEQGAGKALMSFVDEYNALAKKRVKESKKK